MIVLWIIRLIGLLLALISLIYLCLVVLADNSNNASALGRLAWRVIEPFGSGLSVFLHIPAAIVLFLVGIGLWLLTGSAGFLSKRI